MKFLFSEGVVGLALLLTPLLLVVSAVCILVGAAL